MLSICTLIAHICPSVPQHMLSLYAVTHEQGISNTSLSKLKGFCEPLSDRKTRKKRSFRFVDGLTLTIAISSVENENSLMGFLQQDALTRQELRRSQSKKLRDPPDRYGGRKPPGLHFPAKKSRASSRPSCAFCPPERGQSSMQT